MWSRYRDDLKCIQPAARFYLLGSVLMGVAHAVPWTLFALYLDLAEFDKQEIGFAQAADAFGRAIVSLPVAFFVMRRAAGPLFVKASMVAGCCYMALPWMTSLTAVCAVSLMAGIALSVHYIAMAPFVYRHTGARERAAVFSIAEALRTFATVLGAFGAGRFTAFMAPQLGSDRVALGWAITIGGVIALGASLLFRRIVDEAPSLGRGVPVLPALKKHRGSVARFALPQFFIAMGSGLCIPFLSLYFKDRFGQEPGDWGTLAACGQLLMTTGFLMAPFAIARLGFVRSMVLIEFASIPFFLLLAFTQEWWIAVFAFLMRGALMNATHPIQKHLMMEATEPGVREVQVGVQATLWGLGWVIGPPVAGRILLSTGNDYSVLMLTTVGFYLVAGITSWTLLKPVEARIAERAAGASAGVSLKPASEEVS